MNKKKTKQSKQFYRSKFEERIAQSLEKRKVDFKYEEVKYPLEKPVFSGFCSVCGATDTKRRSWYTPDWFIYVDGKLQFLVETKGKFTTDNRRTLLTFKEQHPELDIRIVFMKDNKLNKGARTTYGQWADKNGFTWAVGDIPNEWIC